MPNNDYRRRSPSPRHGRSNRAHDGRTVKRSRSRHREERRSPARNGHRSAEAPRKEYRRSPSPAPRREEGARHVREEGARHVREEGGRHVREEGARHVREEGARHVREEGARHVREEGARGGARDARKSGEGRSREGRRSPRREERRSPEQRRRSPVRTSPTQPRSRPHPMDEIDPWSQTNKPQPSNDPSPAVMKGLHSVYDFQPPSPSRAMSLRFPGPRRGPRIDENITVDIQRKITGISTDYIDRSYNPDMVVIPRRRDEGHIAMFERDDVKAAIEAASAEPVVERRVVKLAGGSKRPTERKTGVASYDQSHEGFKVELRMAPARSGSPEYRSSRRSNKADDRSSRDVGRSREDLRLSLNTKRSRDGPSHDRERSPVERRAIRDRLGTRSDDRQRPTDRRPSDRGPERVVRGTERPGRGPERGPERVVRGLDRSPMKTDARSRLGDRSRERREEEQPLPDFSRRPEKYKYQEWMDRPEMVPRASTYFDHDDRDGMVLDDQISPRGRGRGRGRGFPGGSYRGSFRGSSRGSGGFNFSSYRGRGGSRGRGFTAPGQKYFQPGQWGARRDRSPGPRGPAKWEHDKFEPDAVEVPQQ